MRKIFVCLILSLALSFPTAARADNTAYLPILMYHQISENPSRFGTYVISPSEFENDLKLLRREGYTTVTPKDVLRFTRLGAPLPEKPVMLTFDDGFESDYVYAFPLLKKYDMKAVFSVIGRYADQYSENAPKHISYSHTSWPQIEEMHESGLADFQNHTYNMHELANRRGALKRPGEDAARYRAALLADLDKLNQAYDAHIGENGDACFTCPFGMIDANLRDTLKDAGYAMIFTCGQKLNRLTGDADELYNLGRFLRGHNQDVPALIRSWEKTITAAQSSNADKPANPR